MQLMSSGFVHCDPHEGNLLGLPDGRVALLDFGLMAQMRTDHQARGQCSRIVTRRGAHAVRMQCTCSACSTPRRQWRTA